ncbi:phosphodiester glycosidase family protein [Pseudonocardiaceae bacterium YIM PH 21723]|nr:phosphodiester glycosidase family protein [Pseudonocardiaceae bacterium YIM PH 21723]
MWRALFVALSLAFTSTTVAQAAESTELSPGITLTPLHLQGPSCALEGVQVDADLDNPAVRVGLLTPADVARTEVLTGMADRGRAVAAINGDFFDIGKTGSALGAEIQDGALRKGPNPRPEPWNQSVGFDRQGAGRIVDASLDGTVTLPGGRQPLAGLNQPFLPAAGGLGLFTPVWGTESRAIRDAGVQREAIITDGVVTEKHDAPAAGRLAGNAVALVGAESAADLVGALAVGDRVDARYAAQIDPLAQMTTLLGARVVLVRNGAVQQLTDLAFADPLTGQVRNPETAIGFRNAGRQLMLVVVDGRSSASCGVSASEMAQIMRDRGAQDAVMVDGGGSSELVARAEGETGSTVRNVPSDGRERPVPNGIALYRAER